jgi:hypothetical protein
MLFISSSYSQGFSPSAIQWSIPNLNETYDDQVYGDNSNFSVIDFDGDGLPDLVDAESNTGEVWINGSQKYWMVYLNSAEGFSSTGIQWNIPDLGETYDDQVTGDNSNFAVVDFNGDNKPDLIDAEDNVTGNAWTSGSQKYWKVYLNTGTGFSAVSIQWNIPDLGETSDDQVYGDNSNFTVLDFNGDNKPDLIDAEDNVSLNVWTTGSQKYWKVYLNTGAGFTSTDLTWNIFDLGELYDDQIYGDNSNFSVLDFNGDGKPDLIDAEDNTSLNVPMLGSQRFWRVYINTGSGFAATATNWNIPALGEIYDDQVYGDNSNFSVMDFDGDGKPDLVDAEDNISGNVWATGAQKYWAVFLNNGTGFAAIATQWNIPALGEAYDDQVYGDNSNFSVLDMNGDDKPDLIDAEDNVSTNVWMNGQQRYWNVFINSGSGSLAIPDSRGKAFALFPNPFTDSLTLATDEFLPDAEFNLYSTTGQQVYSAEIFSAQQVFPLNLQSGIYFYRITSNNTVLKSGKLIRK